MTTSAGGGALGSILTGVAAPDLYRGNAFRLSGLPVDASARDVRRRVTELEAGERLGAEWTPPPSPGRPSPGPDRAEVHRALQHLRDPARRIVDELFWLWPMPDGGIGGDDLLETATVWAEAVDGDDPAARAVALHNRAVVAHAKAVEVNITDDKHAVRWRRAYERWRLAIAEDACWNHLRERVEAIGDPRLSSVDVDTLRDRLPHALLTLHARLAVAAALKNPGGGRRHLKALHRSGFDERLIDTVLRAAVETHAGHVRTSVERLRADRLDGEDHQETVTHALAVADGEDLRVLRTILGEEDDLAGGVADELASAIRECVVAEINGTREDHPSVRAEIVRGNLAHLEAALDLAVGVNTTTHIEQDLAVVLNNLVVAMCDAALEDGEARPGRGHALQGRLVAETRVHLARVFELDPAAGSRVGDDVVGTSLVLLFKYVTETREVTATLKSLRDLQGKATGARLREELAEAIRSLETAARMPGALVPPSTRDLFDRPGRMSGARCVLCGGYAGTERLVEMARYGESTRVAPRFVEVPSCWECHGRPIGTGAHAAVTAMFTTSALVLAVAGGFVTDFTYEGVLGWILGLLAVGVLVRLLAVERRARQKIVAGHPQVWALLARNHRIIR